ncbi:MAG: SDR family oxidoreductase [Propionibacteriaceae bacterium]|jgi:NAD(P)-dependent dehydrogenase (short-subunit alcohol dehydrogenase family)|nr:SDR family oxidoreductase [Propionibacteriaceae bacterium]
MVYAIDLSDKVAIVTGAGRGMGLVMAELLAQSGAQVVVADVLPRAEAAEGLEKLAQIGGRPPIYLRHNLAIEQECQAVVAETVAQCGRVDILVNNAAVTKQPWQLTFEINTLAPYHLMVAAHQDMRRRHYGKIVNVTTSGTFSGGGDGIEYNATKGALDNLTRYLGKRFAADGVIMNAVAPGPTLTDMMRKYYGEDEYTAHYLPTMPLGRTLVPLDLAKVVLFLCSELSDSLVGETLLPDGGRARLNP